MLLVFQPNSSCLLVFILGEKGEAYTLMTSADQNFAGDLVRNLVSNVNFQIGLINEGLQ